MIWAFKLAHPKLLYEGATSLSFTFILSSSIQVIIYFILLGICASDYLCPSVASLSGSEESASSGVLAAVLLSWCNSSPDLFSNFMSWTSRSLDNDSNNKNFAALSVGEVLGACGIILCVVEGSIFMLMSFLDLNIMETQRKTILKDLGFTSVAILAMWYVCVMNKVTVFNCIVMIMIYVIYLTSKFIYKGQKKADNVEDEEEPYNLELSSQTSDEGIDAFTGHIRPNILTAMDFNNLLSVLESSNKSVDQEQLTTLEAAYDDNLNMDDMLDIPRRASTVPITEARYTDVPNFPNSAPETFQSYRDDPGHELMDDQYLHTFNMTVRSSKTKIMSKYKKNFFRMFLPHLMHFSQKSKIDAILSVITSPFVIILRLSCPQPLKIIDYDIDTKKYVYSKIDMAILFLQTLLSPLFSFFILSCIMSSNFSLFIWTIPILLSSLFIFLAVVYYRTIIAYNKFSIFTSPSFGDAVISDSSAERRIIEKLTGLLRILLLVICITNTILWISLIANALIEILEIYQNITGISEAILGLTIFAWGNSVSDLISNIAMCNLYKKQPDSNGQNLTDIATKFFMISCSSCVGSVMLNSMGGIGVSGLFSMIFIHKESHRFWLLRNIVLNESEDGFEVKFIVSCVALLIQVILLFLTFGGIKSSRDWIQSNKFGLGLTMCCLWALSTLINILLEIFI
ncbi:hypothetical protein TPHA_0I03000 [Tetrapisispora phaffii CBS 4417]|uniref:Sodium/calcium exchanger membrane region domain-containing protein n=1 Tax=Tetrapisispora phaffii (strain ATCC 24235 / CBS 4417 / NBRC 1672 / NRRL Y-8282 / UCD 70-5) TaxID=1071381 RepID=G8BY23_TETPH|nr:hypothetical protein TPHA_0I03000 [Tetrapisispora phaffii CBS 4417]CCE64801.1 hypothetical protein TPHA_0I03000 [Tetrapisispora phaffii CBS 4417]